MRSGLDDPTRGTLLLPVLQLLAYRLALTKGLDPRPSPHLDAVVKL
jgi:glucosamine 6-phosphate synthetase-like amidotransferase/phosphosugar isomerase protein